jgi:N-methylhydantoinase A
VKHQVEHSSFENITSRIMPSAETNRQTISVDIGGTFTDIVLMQGNKIRKTFKISTSVLAPADAVIEGIRSAGIDHIDEVIHATTIATNSILGQYNLELPKTALLTTYGFADVIEIGRQNRPSIYNLKFRKPVPLVPRNLRYEVNERTGPDGKVIKPASAEVFEKICVDLSAQKVDAIAVSFLHSYLNPRNEILAGKILRRMFDHVSLSYEVSAEPREFERTSTAVVNAALSPIMSDYLKKLSTSLSRFGCRQVSMMSNSGGVMRLQDAVRRPIKIIESGPTAGVIAANEFARAVGDSNVISFDMGGTTAKASAIIGNMIGTTAEYEVGGSSNHGRMIKGTGYPVRAQFVDIAEVSAGGGTVIWKDDAGSLNIGPQSAGSDPGPACYGLGGDLPTITDANLVLGYISRESPGRTTQLDVEKSLESLSKLGDAVKIAEKAISLADLEMARAIRLVTYERGLDPARFVLYAFGGAGPQHAARVAELLGAREVIIPTSPAEFSAIGLVQADWKYEESMAFPSDLKTDYDNLAAKIRSIGSNISIFLSADCRYKGQGSDLSIPVPSVSMDKIKEDFETLHRSTYGFTLPREVEISEIRVTGIRSRQKPGFERMQKKGRKPYTRKARESGKWLSLTVYSRDSLPSGSTIKGPAIIDEPGTSTLIPAGWSSTIGSHGEIRMVLDK